MSNGERIALSLIIAMVSTFAIWFISGFTNPILWGAEWRAVSVLLVVLFATLAWIDKVDV